MSWAQDQRQAFIRETLERTGRIGRADITERFGVSKAIASADFSRFAEENPDAAPYDESAKCYIANVAILPRREAPTLLEAVRAHLAARDALEDTPLQRLAPSDPRFAAVAYTLAVLRALSSQAGVA